jgi:hypothetical protein
MCGRRARTVVSRLLAPHSRHASSGDAIDVTTPRGGSDEPRPHLIPVTDEGRRLVEIDASGFIGTTGLCPGQVTLDDGSTTLAYRFITLTDEGRDSLLGQLDEAVENLQRAARD